MDFDVKKLVREAGSALSRVVQRTEEKLGTAEKTELDAHFENLAERADTTKVWTEKLVANTEAVLTPNPGYRVEDFIYERIDKKRPSRLSNLEYLGLDMIEAGNEFGPGTSYGSALIKVGHYEQRLGQAERDFIGTAALAYIQPLKKFLEGEMKTIQKERSLLESKRLDLDACKNRVRKARGMIGQVAKDGLNPEIMLDQAERDLRVAQSEFDRQAEITKLLLEGVNSSHAGHLRCLHEFIDTQVRYYAQCHTIMQELQKDFASLNIGIGQPYIPTNAPELSPGSGRRSVSPVPEIQIGDKMPQTRAKVLYDYEAKDSSELSLVSDEIVYVQDIADEDYLMGYRGTRRGKVPKAFLEILLT